MADFSERLRTLLEHLKISESELARQTSVSASLINRAVKGERAAGKGSRSLILGAYLNLGVDPAYWSSEGPPGSFIRPLSADEQISEMAGGKLGPIRDLVSTATATTIDRLHEQIAAESERVRSAMVYGLQTASASRQLIEAFQGLPPPSDALLQAISASANNAIERVIHRRSEPASLVAAEPLTRDYVVLYVQRKANIEFVGWWTQQLVELMGHAEARP